MTQLSFLISRSLSDRTTTHCAIAFARNAVFSNSIFRVRYSFYHLHMQNACVLDDKAESLVRFAAMQEVRS